MTRSYFNAATETIINFDNADGFVIIGDEDNVSDDTLRSLFNGQPVDGWELS